MAEGYACAVDEKYRSACKDLPEYSGSWYCVLHEPDEAKNIEDFLKVKNSKLDRKDYDFGGTVFPEGTSIFEGFEFDASANFAGATFIGGAQFRDATFSGEQTDFSDAQFSGEGTSFASAQFSGEAAYFSDAQFSSEWTDFLRASFAQRTSFYGASFSGEVDFSSASFAQEISFSSASFAQRTSFYEVSFSGVVDFSRAGFEESVLFVEPTFDSQAVVDFRYTRIQRPERFSFYRTKLHANWFVDVDSLLFDFTLVEWYGLPNGPEGSLDEEIQALYERGLDSPQWLLQQTCQRLSYNALETRDYQTAGEFHYWASDITRRWGWRITSPPEFWGNFLHWVLNGYGERPYRAFLTLLAIWGIFALLYMAAGPEELKALSALLALDLWEFVRRASGAVSYSLGVMVRLNPEPKATPGFFQFLVSLEGLLGPLQFAMLVIATRRYIPWLAEAVGRGASQSN